MSTVRYRIEAGRSRFTVQGSAEGLLSMFGHDPLIAIRGFGGDASFVPGTLESASLLMLVQADSLAVLNKVSDKDKGEMERAMRDEVLEIARYPEITFVSKSVKANPVGEGRYRIGILGSLSLHGVTRDHKIDAQLTLSGNSLRAEGEFRLRQTDYHIKPVSVAGGTLKMKDELKFKFDIRAERQG
ncbi:MAG TPA: YceI family protein [Pyrinomonadaceae bacterium]|jgi:polyisoprenoid-binding protein YceI